jgi:ABC-type cobalamin transport system permease subunit
MTEALAFGFSFAALLGAGIFFWRDKKVAGFAFLVAFIVAFAAVLHQRVVLSSAVIGVSVERIFPEVANDR